MSNGAFYSEDFRTFLCRYDACIDLVVTSPPYVDARTPEAYGLDAPWTVQDDRDLGDALFAALRPGGTAIVNVGSPVRRWRKGHSTERGLEPARWLIDLADRVGFTIRDVLTYGRMGLPGEYAGRFRNDWEPVLWLERPGGKPTFDKTTLDAPSLARPGGIASSRKADGTMSVRIQSGDAVERGIKRRGTVWDYGNVGNAHSATPVMEATKHPAAFPIAFARDAVLCFSRAGDLVADPFCGRGTVAVVCKKYGRRSVNGDLGKSIEGRPWAEIAADMYKTACEHDTGSPVGAGRLSSPYSFYTEWVRG